MVLLMTIKIATGDLLKQKVDALVNTVNCVGVMGKGIALQFKLAFPANYKAYVKACKTGEIIPGEVFVYDNGGLLSPRYIINFPTKGHWKDKSQIEDISSGLDSLIKAIKKLNIKSIAIPPLGCGNGGLNWSEVLPLIQKAIQNIPEVDVLLFEPKGAPAPKDMQIRTEKPAMTFGRAALIKLLSIYREFEYSLSNIEVQKLAYFLEMAGVHLKLKFEKNKFGPYSKTLPNVLALMEGHFIRGIGDGSKRSEINVLPEGITEADEFLENSESSLKQELEKVSNLIQGFETPYGMELLATVHWIAKEKNIKSAKDITEAVYEWSDKPEWNKRKKSLMSEDHVKIAWNQLKEQGWFH